MHKNGTTLSSASSSTATDFIINNEDTFTAVRTIEDTFPAVT